jgi:predicted phage terminase large subunit-like protein
MADVLNSLLQLAPGLRPLLAERLAADLAAFARAAWPVVFPGRKFVWSPAYDLLCESLTAMARRDPRYRRVIWNMPTRTAKSFFCSICFPVWVWLSDPAHCFVCASYSMDLSIEHSIARRNLIQSPWFLGLFGNRFQLAGDRNLTSQFSNDHRGTMLACSTGGRLLGFGFDSAICDDLCSATMAMSDAERTSSNAWFDHTLRQRANDPATASILVVSQRVAELDVPGHLLQSEPGVWTHVRIPLVAEEPEEHVFPISGKVWERPAGDVFQPRRFPAKVVEELQQRRMVYAGQYQQAPAPLQGNLVRTSDLRHFAGVDPVTGAPDEQLPDAFDLKIISVDCSFKNYVDSDYTAILTIGVKGRKRFVLDCINAHLDVSGMEAAIRTQRDRWGPIQAVLVESAASGIAVAQRLKVNVGGVIEVTPQGGKVARMMAASPEFQAHDWYFDRNAAWTPVLTQQLLFFPRGRNDDLVDAVSQASIWLQAHATSGEGAPILAGEARFSIASLRDHLNGGNTPGEIPPDVSAKVINGEKLSDRDEWAILASTLPAGTMLE